MPIALPSPRWAVAPRVVVIVLVPSLVGIASMAGQQAVGPAAKVSHPAEILTTLNNASRMMYAQAKGRALSKEGPAMIVIGDDLVMRQGEELARQARFIPDTYHTLKAFSHIPMAFDVADSPHTRTRTPWMRTRCMSSATTAACCPLPGPRSPQPGSTASSASGKRRSSKRP